MADLLINHDDRYNSARIYVNVSDKLLGTGRIDAYQSFWRIYSTRFELVSA